MKSFLKEHSFFLYAAAFLASVALVFFCLGVQSSGPAKRLFISQDFYRNYLSDDNTKTWLPILPDLQKRSAPQKYRLNLSFVKDFYVNAEKMARKGSKMVICESQILRLTLYLSQLQPLAIYCIETRWRKQTQRQKNLFTMSSWGSVIAVRNNSFIDNK